ncbi:unnamed protein product [Spirodela intermedia]|nr:unnamed protein product [Spirodela intermedia]CAA6661974.1 unnamed protein product [Spirodela intermedia]
MEGLSYPLRLSAIGGSRRRPSYQYSPPFVSRDAGGVTAASKVAAAIGVRGPSFCRGRGGPASRGCSMAEGGGAEAPCGLTELSDESDFDALLSFDGYISICGFGSLLSEKSARSTFPELRNFRVAQLRGFRRVFAHTAPTGEISSLSVEPCEGEILVVTVFEIYKTEIPSFIEREHEFRFLAVVPEEPNGSPFVRSAVLCARYSDDEYLRVRCKGSQEIYFQRYGRHNIHKIWRDDILPCRVYLRHCVLAAKNLGQEAYDNFLDHTFIADRETSIRQYLSSTGSGIMQEEPPEA